MWFGPLLFEFYHMTDIYSNLQRWGKKSRSREILIRKSPLPIAHSHSVSYGRFKSRLVGRLVDFLSIEYWTLLFYTVQWCFYHILASSVIYYWTDPRQHGIYLLNIQWTERKMTNLPRIAWLFEDLCQIRCFPNHKTLFSRLYFFFSSSSFLYTVSPKRFSTPSLATRRIIA